MLPSGLSLPEARKKYVRKMNGIYDILREADNKTPTPIDLPGIVVIGDQVTF